jgi:hypothetical protein
LQHIEPILINGQAVKVVEVRTPDGAAEGANGGAAGRSGGGSSHETMNLHLKKQSRKGRGPQFFLVGGISN